MRNLLKSVLLFLMCYSLPVNASEKWKLITPNINAKFIMFDWNGTIYAINTNDEMYYLPARSVKWAALLPGKKIKYMNIYPDGTIFALDKTASLGYRRVNGQWITENGTMKAGLVTKDGSKCMLTTDGKVIYDGKTLTGSYTYISASVQSDGIYLIGTNSKIYGYDKNSTFVSEIVGGGLGKSVAGTGKGLKASQYIIGAGTDANVYYFDIVPPYSNKWTKLESSLFMTFIAMKPNGILYGIGTDNKIYFLTSPY